MRSVRNANITLAEYGYIHVLESLKKNHFDVMLMEYKDYAKTAREVNVQSEESGTTQLVAENIKAASITLSMTPMLVVYPFIQRFFTQGIMLGAVKG